ncbi:putative Amino acid adenylation domain-containing protein [Tenacibaculum sp. 190524A02b]|uniref:Amino acid adenylation domain-containing protein n=1 Tax=Tenacibaculum vairaonense TaxID=3137860 RepID=A0ABP1FDW6_9FLAO
MLTTKTKKGSSLIRVNGKRFDLLKMTYELIATTQVKNAYLFPVKKDKEIIAVVACIVSESLIDISDLTHIDGFYKLKDKLHFIHKDVLPLTSGGKIDELKLKEELDEHINNLVTTSYHTPELNDSSLLLKEVTSYIPPLHQWDISLNPFKEVSYTHKEDYSLNGEIAKNIPMAHTVGQQLKLPENAPKTLKDSLIITAEKYPERGIQFILGDGSRDFINYKDLLVRAKKALAVYRNQGLKPGDTVILNILDNRSFIEAYWGCILGGFLPTPVGAISEFKKENAIVQRLANVWKLLKKPLVVVNQGDLDKLNSIEEIWGEHPLVGIEAEDFTNAIPDENLFDAQPDSPAIQLLTSGSTGVPKCILHRNRTLVNRMWSSKTQDFGKEDEVSLSFLPMDHVGGSLMFSARDVYFGYHQINVKVNQFLEHPIKLLDWVDEFKVTMTWGANFVFALVNEYENEIQKGSWNLSSLHHIMNAAEAVTTNVCQKFLELLTPFGLPNSAMQPSFGMSETSSCILVNHEMRAGIKSSGVAIVEKSSMNGLLKIADSEEIEKGIDETAYTSLPHCGKIAPGSEARITDKQNNIIPEGVIGRLQIKGATIMDGYVDNPKANKEAFVGDGWMNTGDLGFILNENVYITGREKDLIIINGANFLSFEIEAVVDELPGVKNTFSAATGIFDPIEETEKLVVVYVPEVEKTLEEELITIEAIKKSILRSFGLEASYVIPVKKEDFPKTISGKIQRAKIKNRFTTNIYDKAIKAIDVLEKNKRTIPQWFAKPEWQLKKLTNFKTKQKIGKRLLLVNQNVNVDDFITENTIVVQKGEDNGIKDTLQGQTYVINPLSKEGYALLSNSLREEKICEIIYLWSYQKEVTPVNKALGNLHYMLQSLQSCFSDNARLVVVVEDRGEVSQYLGENEALIGYVKTLNIEQEIIKAQLISLDKIDRQACNDIHEEIQQPLIDEIISWRDYNRFVFKIEALKEVEIKSKLLLPNTEQFYNQKWYITGGFGGIGEVLVPHLLKKYKLKLVVLGRKALSEEREVLLQKWQKVGDVSYEKIDFESEKGIENVITNSNEEIQGVFHLAGASLNESFEEPQNYSVLGQPWGYVERQINVKVTIADKILKALGKQKNKSLFVQFSSVNAFFGGNGFSAYSAVTSYQSGLANQSLFENVSIKTIDWSAWEKIGMNKANETSLLAKQRGFLSINPSSGLISFDVAMQLDESRVMVGLDLNNKYIIQETINNETEIVPVLYTTKPNALEVLIQNVSDQNRLSWLNNIQTLQLDTMPKLTDGTINSKQLLHLDIKQKVREIQPLEGEVQIAIAKLWSEVLEVQITDAKANFFDLGGHSIKAIQLISKVNDAYKTNINMAQLFENAVLYKFVDFISGQKEIDYQKIANYGKTDYYPLSHAQKRIWTLIELEGQSKLYNILGAWKINGSINVGKLEAILSIISSRHQSLHLGFKQVNGEPVMFEKDDAKIPLEFIDFTTVPEMLIDKTLDDLITQESGVEYDLEKGDLTRVKLVKIKENQQILLIGQHHIISDGWSLNQLIEEINDLYNNTTVEFTESRIDYTDYVYWEKEQDTNDEQNYWINRLKDYATILELPIDNVRPALYEYTGDTQIINLPEQLQKDLRLLAKEKQTSLYNLLFTAYAIFISKISNNNDLLIGTPVAGRNHKDLNDVIGMFVNTLPIRFQIDNQLSFEENLEKNMVTLQQDLTNDNYPFDELLSDLNLERDLSRPPLIQTLFGFLSADLSINFAGCKASPLHVKHKISKFELSVQILDQVDQIAVSFEYNTSLFKHDTIHNWQNLFVQLLKEISKSSSAPVYKYTMLSNEDRIQVTETFNKTETPYPKESTIYEQFSLQVNKNPQAIAVQLENKSVTYKELDEKVNKWSKSLQLKGIESGEVLAICAKSSLEQIIILLATQQIGATYVALDYELPLERRQFILEDSNAKFLIIQPELNNTIQWNDFPIIELTEEPNDYSESNLELNKQAISSTTNSYICYTSGSTGTPKGVLIPHKAILRLVKDTNYYRITPEDNFMTVVNFAFDSFTFEFWGAMLNGATYYVIDKEKRLDLKFLSNFIKENNITVTFLTVTLFNQIIDQYPDTISKMKCVLVGGEELSVNHMKKALQYLPKGLYNGYGPTENTTFSNVYPITEIGEEQNSIPLGKPIANSKCYVLDNYLQPLPIGVIGEIYLAGDGLATEYLSRPELTTEKFIDNPFVPKTKMYKSGDLGRWTKDGCIEYWGRVDNQVKIRGYRIECGEVEQVISNICKGKDAAVVPQVDKNGHKRLVAYYTDNGISTETIIKSLKEKLPSYMIPSAFMYLEELPKNANSKLDRKRLPKVEIAQSLKEMIAPKTNLQKQLFTVWSDVLDSNTFGIEDSFFDLGGDSILAVSLIGKLQREGIPLDPKMIFMYPTIQELSQAIELGEHKVKRTRTEKDYLIKLSSGSQDKPRVYFLPPAGGTLMGYIELSRNLENVGDVFGLQGPGLFEDEAPQFLSYEQMLDIFEKAVKDHFRPGVDYFAGHSLGGHLAFGLTQRMEKKGIPVKGLLILDTVPNMHVEAEEKVEMSQEELKMFALVLGMGNMVGMQPDDFKNMDYEAAKKIILDKAREDAAVKEFMNNEYLDKYLQIQMNHMLLSQMMELDTTLVNTEVTVFKTAFHNEDFENRFNEWNELAVNPVNILPSEGNHVTMIRRPYVVKLGNQIDALLQDVKMEVLSEI